MLTAATVDVVLGDRERVRAALHEAHRCACQQVAADLLSHVEYRVAQLLGVAAQFDAPEDTGSAQTSVIDACMNFAEQWVVDVALMPTTLVEEVRAPLGTAGLSDFVHGLLVVEQRMRLAIAWNQLGLVTNRHTPAAPPYRALDLRGALGEWQAAVVCLDTVDPVTTELVRLRCANYHDCHT